MAFKPQDYIKHDQKIENLKKKGVDIKDIQTEQMKDMGILEKECRYDIIASTFVKYCMKRIAVHQNGEPAVSFPTAGSLFRTKSLNPGCTHPQVQIPGCLHQFLLLCTPKPPQYDP